MDVAGQFEEVGFVLHDDRAVTILEQVAVPAVASVEAGRIPGEEAAHNARERPLACPQEEMDMIREQGPGEHLGPAGRDLSGETVEKVRPVLIGAEEQRVLDPPGHHVVEHPGRIQAGTAWHEESLPQAG